MKRPSGTHAVLPGSTYFYGPPNIKGKELRYLRNLICYFEDLGASNIEAAMPNEAPATLRKKISRADVVYLPGGSPRILMNHLSKFGIDRLLSSFEGIIIGNSAGAMILGEGFITIMKNFRD